MRKILTFVGFMKKEFKIQNSKFKIGQRGIRAAVTCAAVMLLVGAVGVGCKSTKKPVSQPITRYPTLPPKKVPGFMKGTIYELCDLTNTEPLLASGYGLVVNLQPGTGDTKAPVAVRDYMIKEMAKHGFGSSLMPEQYKDLTPEMIMSDPHKRTAIVVVEGYIPPGARPRQQFDVQVSVMPNNDTTSLARGNLFQTDLRENGANVFDPSGAINVLARTQGPVFINPALTLRAESSQNTARASRRTGWILDGGECEITRPLVLRLRTPQWSMSSRIAQRVMERFQDSTESVIPAKRENDGLVSLIVPESYKGDWEHFAGVCTHLYMSNPAGSVVKRAELLAAEAEKPDAKLLDISYCWEGLGPEALQFIRPLMNSPKPEVAFAATRAAAFLGDSTAPGKLLEIAKNANDPFQLNAVTVLGQMPSSPAINAKVRELLNGDQAKVRIEAYRVLAQNRDPKILSKVINEKFVLDIVPSQGPPMIYASRRGTPRLALIGDMPSLTMPITFTAMDQTLTISSALNNHAVLLFYRGIDVPRDARHLPVPVKILSRTDIGEIVGWLGGEASTDQGMHLDFSYGDIVGIVQSLCDRQQVATNVNGQRVPASFVLQDMPELDQELRGAPSLEKSRPQADPVGQVGLAAPAGTGAGQ
jgi:hypothetical protein